MSWLQGCRTWSATDVVFALVAATTGIYFALWKHTILVQQLAREVAGHKRANDTLAIVSRAVEQPADLIMSTDRRCLLVYVNPEFEQQTGYSKSEAVGRSPRLLKSDSESRMKAAAAGFLAGADKDLVCGMQIDPLKAGAAGRKSLYEGKSYFFCSERCRQDFDRDPRRFLDVAPTPQTRDR